MNHNALSNQKVTFLPFGNPIDPVAALLILYDLGEAFYGIVKLQTTLDIRWLFRGDAIISPSIYTVVLFPSHLLSI